MAKSIKTTYLIKKGVVNALITFLTTHHRIPEIHSSMAMYANYKDKVIEVKFMDSTCYLRSYDKSSVIDKQFMNLFNSTPPIRIGNNNIKYFLRIIKGFGFSKAYITKEVIQLNYRLSDDGFINLDIGTPIGDLLIVDGNLPKAVKSAIPQFVEGTLKPHDIDDLFTKVSFKENLFDNAYLLNNKIINYSDKFGIDIASSGSSSIESKLSNKSNDYSYFESYYKKVMGFDLNLNRDGKRLKKYLFKPLSIIISSYNSNESLAQVLYSIESQDIYLQQKKLIDVILVDDGSDIPAVEYLRPYLNDFSFNLNIIRFEQNRGLSNARNMGAAHAIYNNILFIDSDILLAKNYLLEHSVSLQMFPHAVFVSMKKNIAKTAKMNNISVIKSGLKAPSKYDDKRISRIFREAQTWINPVNLNGVYETLSDTNLFKNLGHRRIVNGYDLPSMVTGHNMSMSKDIFIKTGGFSTRFHGWGLEDTYFGAQVISNGGFVIPLINTGVYHINHPPRLGSEKKMMKALRKNLVTYNTLIKKKNENIFYRS